jgi:CRP/FNR family transcriptional regulator
MLIRGWSELFEAEGVSQAVTIREWRQLLSLGSSKVSKAGMRMLDQSAAPLSLYLLESGIVKLSHVNSNGDEIALLLRFPGDILGGYGVLLQLPHLLTATAVTDCRTVQMPASDALNIFLNDPKAACFFAQQQTIDTARISALLMEARTLGAERRLYRFLLQLGIATQVVNPSASCVSVRVPLSEADIADLIAMNRTAFSRLKRSLIRSGDLQQRGDCFSFRRYLAESNIVT